MQTLSTDAMSQVAGGAIPLAFFVAYVTLGPAFALGVANGVAEGVQREET